MSISDNTTIPIMKASPTVGLTGSVPSIRRTFYKVDDTNQAYIHGSLNKTELIETCKVAKTLLKWLLSIPVTINSTSDLGFVATIMHDGSASTLTVENILKTYPTIYFEDWGMSDETKAWFVPLERRLMDHLEGTEGLVSFDMITQALPATSHLFDRIKPRCTCSSCVRIEPIGAAKIGCLRESALKVIIMFLGDAISQGFGAKDASGLTDNRLLKNSVQQLFHELIVKEQIN